MTSRPRLVHTEWGAELAAGLKANHTSVRIVSPFIKRKAAERLLARGTPTKLLVVTRLNLNDFSNGVSDTGALRMLMEHGARIRGLRHLHAKLYLFGSKRAIVTSANLTEAAMVRNHELGYVVREPAGVDECRAYFDRLWGGVGQDLSTQRLGEIEDKVNAFLARGAHRTAVTALGDEGVAVLEGDAAEAPPWASEPVQSLVKFFGTSKNRAPRSMAILREVERSGCHWACTYPLRPRRVKEGAVMFLGRLVRDPNDILIFGRAVGMKYMPGRDDATPQDIARRDWKVDWPRYIRVHHAEFVSGDLVNGISLNRLMDELDTDAFATTQRHARSGSGNRNPRRAYMRKPDVELSPEGHAWLTQRLQSAFATNGRLNDRTLAQLDWPDP